MKSKHLKRMIQTAGYSWQSGEHEGIWSGRQTKPTLYQTLTKMQLPHPNLAMPMAALIIFSLLTPLLNARADAASYDLNKASGLLTSTNKDLQGKLAYDAQSQSYIFNKNASSGLSGQTGTSSSVGAVTYSSTLPLNLTNSTPLSLTDATTKNTISLTPEFLTSSAKEVEHHVVYPLMADNGQLIYTPESDGLKEDIVLYSSPGSTASYSYKLQLPNGMESRLEKDGSIGIYGGDSALFGNVSAGDAKDQALLDNARKNAKKDHLYYAIPAPTITGDNQAKASFALDSDNLTINVSGLNKAHYPLSIDPSFVMNTSNCGWTQGNYEEQNFDISGCSLNRASLTGGSINGWTSPGNDSEGETDFIYNGRGYIFSTCFAKYMTLGIDGSTFLSPSGSGTSTNAPCYTSWDITSFAMYNGYAYAVGGTDRTATNPPCGGTLQPACTYAFTSNDSVYYAKVNSDGSLGTWIQTSTLATHHDTGGAVPYNGYMYVYNQYNSSTSTTSNGTTQYAKINADGTLGAWQTSTANSSPTSIANSGYAIYNGYFYTIGGTNTGNTAGTTSVYYAPVSSSGFGTWQSTNSLVTGVSFSTALAYRGYLYMAGGCTALTTGACTNSSGQVNTFQYAPIYANGALGAWQTSSAFATGRDVAGLIAHNNYIYLSGGSTCSGASGACTSTTADVDFQYATINAQGVTSPYNAGGTYNSTGILGAAYVVYNSYIYVIGGTTINSGAPGSQLNTARYAKLNSDGSIASNSGCGSSWCTSSTGFADVTSVSGDFCHTNGNCSGRLGLSAGVYNGYLYIAGGASNGNTTFWSDVQSAQILSNGDLGTWSTKVADFATNSATTYSDNDGMAGIGMRIYNGNMYLVGGENVPSTNAVQYSTIYYASLTSTGGVGSFATTTSLPQARQNVKTFVSGGKLYIVGGGSGGWAVTNNDNDDVQFVSINSNGTLGSTWTDANASSNGGSGSSFATAGNLQDYSIYINNNYLYIAGGQNGTGAANTFTTVYKAPINSNGSMGTWSTITSFATGRYMLGTLVSNGYLYIIGGCGNKGITIGNSCNSTSDMLTDVQYSQIQDGGPGTAATWGTGTATSARSNARAVVANGYLYVIAGGTAVDCSNQTTTVQYTKLDSNNLVSGSWTTAAHPLPTALCAESAVVVGNYLYVIGGAASSGGASANVWYSQLDPSTGAPGAWTTLTNSLQVATYASNAVAYNGYIYLIDGRETNVTTPMTTEYTYVGLNGGAPTNPGCGTTWCVTTSLPSGAGAYGANAVAYGGNIYLMNGLDSTSTGRNSVYFAPLSSGGIGSWTPTSSTLLAGYQSVAFAANGYVYLMGGAFGGACSNLTQYAPFLSNGHLGNWQSTTAIPTGRNEAFGAYYQGEAYFIGGQPCGSPVTTVNEVAIQAQPAASHYSLELTTDKNTLPANYFLNYTVDGISSQITLGYETAAGGSQTWSSLTSTSNPGSGTKVPMTISGDGVAYYWLYITIDDSQSMAFGETSPSSISYLQLNYHPNPSMRLRGGQTFNANSLQSLDAPGQ